MSRVLLKILKKAFEVVFHAIYFYIVLDVSLMAIHRTGALLEFDSYSSMAIFLSTVYGVAIAFIRHFVFRSKTKEKAYTRRNAFIKKL